MNIFETHEGFSGRFDPDSTGGTLLSLFTLARDIRLKLGKQGYLLDSYLSLFLEGANAMLSYEAGSDGFERGGELRSLCFDVLDRTNAEKDHPFYDTALNTLIARMDTMRYQERQTRMNLLYAALADEFLPFAVKHFLREVEHRIGDGCDIPKLKGLYQRISEVVGEPPMETLNLRQTAIPHRAAGSCLCAGGDKRLTLLPTQPGQRNQSAGFPAPDGRPAGKRLNCL